MKPKHSQPAPDTAKKPKAAPQPPKPFRFTDWAAI